MNNIHSATPGIGVFINNKKFPLDLAIKMHFSLKIFLAPIPSHHPSLGGEGWSERGKGGVNHEMGGPPPPTSIWLPA